MFMPRKTNETQEQVPMSYYGWKPYVSVAQRRAKAEKAASKQIKGGATLAPIAAYRGAVAKTVWGRAWCDNLERYSDYANRLPRGRTYVRNGSVIDLRIKPGEVLAQVMGSSLYKVSVTVGAVPATQWRAICTDCAGTIDSLVEILQGKLSSAVMQRICQQGDGLFPTPKEITFDCSCPDWASMCKHVAAVLYGIGARLDQQPELLFGLRHVDAKDLITEAGAGLIKPVKRPKAAKLLDEASLADVFGIEMAEATPPAKPAKPATQRKQAAGAKVAVKKANKSTATTNAKPKAPAKTVTGKKAAAKKLPVKPRAVRPGKS